MLSSISSLFFVLDEDGSGVFLVDFQKKVLDNVEENREKERREKEEREAEEERQLQAEPIPEPETEEEEWYGSFLYLCYNEMSGAGGYTVFCKEIVV